MKFKRIILVILLFLPMFVGCNSNKYDDTKPHTINEILKHYKVKNDYAEITYDPWQSTMSKLFKIDTAYNDEILNKFADFKLTKSNNSYYGIFHSFYLNVFNSNSDWIYTIGVGYDCVFLFSSKKASKYIQLFVNYSTKEFYDETLSYIKEIAPDIFAK